MKKIIVFILIVALIITSVAVLAACSKKNREEPISGGWAAAQSPVITEEINALMDKVNGVLAGAQYTPVAYLASQIVAGRNHRILCKSTPTVPDAESTYVIVTIYEDLQGNAEITSTLESDAYAPSGEQLMGGWSDAESPVITDDVRAMVGKACKGYTPVALVATQVVAGTNYCILCNKDGGSNYFLAYIYQDLDGKAELTETKSFK